MRLEKAGVTIVNGDSSSIWNKNMSEIEQTLKVLFKKECHRYFMINDTNIECTKLAIESLFALCEYLEFMKDSNNHGSFELIEHKMKSFMKLDASAMVFAFLFLFFFLKKNSFFIFQKSKLWVENKLFIKQKCVGCLKFISNNH